MIVRPLRPADLPALLALDAATNPHPWSRAQWLDSLAQNYCLGLESTGELRGFVIALLLPDEAEILLIATAPEVQRQGLGKQLLTTLCACMTGSHRTRLLLEVRESNIQAQSFYAAVGMRPIGRRKAYYPTDTGREDALLYSLDLMEKPA